MIQRHSERNSEHYFMIDISVSELSRFLYTAGMGRKGRERFCKIIPKCQVLLTRRMVVPLGRRIDYEKTCALSMLILGRNTDLVLATDLEVIHKDVVGQDETQAASTLILKSIYLKRVKARKERKQQEITIRSRLSLEKLEDNGYKSEFSKKVTRR